MPGSMQHCMLSGNVQLQHAKYPSSTYGCLGNGTAFRISCCGKLFLPAAAAWLIIADMLQQGTQQQQTAQQPCEMLPATSSSCSLLLAMPHVDSTTPGISQTEAHTLMHAITPCTHAGVGSWQGAAGVHRAGPCGSAACGRGSAGVRGAAWRAPDQDSHTEQVAQDQPAGVWASTAHVHVDFRIYLVL